MNNKFERPDTCERPTIVNDAGYCMDQEVQTEKHHRKTLTSTLAGYGPASRRQFWAFWMMSALWNLSAKKNLVTR